MNSTPKGNRVHIGIFGRRNVGKSSFINAFVGQDLSIVSDTPGTTTDPVEKAYELQPFGPVVFIDTAGIDDTGELGIKRVERTKAALDRTDLAIVMTDCTGPGEFEDDIIRAIGLKGIPWFFVINKIDLAGDNIETVKDLLAEKYNVDVFGCSSLYGANIEAIKKSVAEKLDRALPDPALLADLVRPSDTVVLVVPIDKEAPKGRLILPQVQTIRELLDFDATAVVVKERELDYALNHVLKEKPALVITDSQAFLKVDADTPSDIPLTSFSILFARQKGDLDSYIKGLDAIDHLGDGDKILVAELCSHHPIADDIGRVKIPRWLRNYSGRNLSFDFTAGKDYPEDLEKYSLVIQCGGCMVNRRLILNRIRSAVDQGVPITNYGLIIAKMHGILERALKTFFS
ncbi:MAG: [FeFe] hydrogenase H-cluster maturation GTPase HydF [Desulfobacteraceae bacterium]|jgi:[FeFe] hydrogenase H-cluster maturation GTPase HydF